MEEEPSPCTLEQATLLLRDAKRCKHRHFFAGDRKQAYVRWLGVPAIAVNCLLATLGERLLTVEPGGHMALACLAAVLVGLQTFFGFDKAVAGHRSIGNRYLRIAKRLEWCIAMARDGVIERAGFLSEVERLQDEYNQVNLDAESFVTAARDYERALVHMERTARERPLTLDVSAGSGGTKA